MVVCPSCENCYADYGESQCAGNNFGISISNMNGIFIFISGSGLLHSMIGGYFSAGS